METAIATANQALFHHLGRHLSDVETTILKGAWEGWTYDQIAKGSGYSDSYLRRDVGAKFWRALSEALGETVSKTSFREALSRHQGVAQDPATSWAGPVPASPASDTVYIERLPQETICYDTLQQPGALVRVKSPSLMGKTLMMDRVLAKLAEQQLRTVRLSMVLADRKTHFSDLNRFLRWLCINISRSLGVPHQIDDYWDEEGMGSKVSCSTYLEEYLLSISQAPLVLCFDNIDLLFSYPDIYEDFFALLRSWYELARTRTRPLWKQLRLCIVHATDAYIPLNIHQSPFNVGVPLELPEFTPEQAQTFASQHQLDHLDLAKLMDMIGGHPYLMQQTFEYLKGHPELSLTDILANAPTESGIYANHLRDCWLTLRDQPQLKEILLAVIMAQQPVAIESIFAHQLYSMGIIKLQGNLATPRCRLYRDYFQACLDVT